MISCITAQDICRNEHEQEKASEQEKNKKSCMNS